LKEKIIEARARSRWEEKKKKKKKAQLKTAERARPKPALLNPVIIGLGNSALLSSTSGAVETPAEPPAEKKMKRSRAKKKTSSDGADAPLDTLGNSESSDSIRITGGGPKITKHLLSAKKYPPLKAKKGQVAPFKASL
jgi:hypothetical protein